MEKRIKQSNYYNLLRVFAALLLGIFVYFAAIVMYYGNPAKVVKAEIIGGLLFSVAFALLFLCLLSCKLFDKKYYASEDSVKVSAYGKVKSARLSDAVRTDLLVTPVMRLFKSARLKIYFTGGQRCTLYLGKEDAEYLVSLLYLPKEREEGDKTSKKDILKSASVSLLYAAVVLTALGIFLFPLFFYQIYDAGINIPFFEGGFLKKAALLSLIIYGGVLASEAVIAAVVALTKILFCAGCYGYFEGEYFGLSKKGLIFYDKMIIKKNINGAYTKETKIGKIFGMQCAGISMDIGRQSARISIFKCAVSKSRAERAVVELLGDLPQKKEYNFKQSLPLLVIYCFLFGLPIIMYAIISGPSVLILAPVFAIFFTVQSQNRSFAAEKNTLAFSVGIWVKRSYYIYLNKATCLRVKEGPFVKMFDMKNAQICFGEGGDCAYIPALLKEQISTLKEEFLSDKKTVDI